MKLRLLLGLIVSASVSSCIHYDCAKYFDTKIKPHAIQGHVTKLYKDAQAANLPRIVIQQQHSTYLLTPTYYDNSGLLDAVQVGDSLSKPSGSLDFTHIRAEKRQIFTLACKPL